MPVRTERALWDLMVEYTDPSDGAADRRNLLEMIRMLTVPYDRREKFFADRDAAAALRDAIAADDDVIADQRDALRAEQDAEAIAQNPAVADLLAGYADDRLRAASERARARENRRLSYVDRIAAAYDRSMSSIDDLTGAFRRDAGIRKLSCDLEAATRDHMPVTVVFIDVDGLKAVNDVRGHSAGDDLLKQVVVAVTDAMRPSDPVVRYGGDEFLLGAVDLTSEEVERRMMRVNDCLRRTHGASVTYGLATSRPSETLADLVGRADRALYRRRMSMRRTDTA